jgi:hypothetical protein
MSDPIDPKLAELMAELAEVKAERDMYRKVILDQFAKGLKPITAEELADLQANGVPFEEFVEEISREVGPDRSPSGGNGPTALPIDPQLAEVLAELAEVKAERDRFLKAVYARTREPVLITQDELADAAVTGSSFEEILAAIERTPPAEGTQEAGQ